MSPRDERGKGASAGPNPLPAPWKNDMFASDLGWTAHRGSLRSSEDELTLAWPKDRATRASRQSKKVERERAYRGSRMRAPSEAANFFAQTCLKPVSIHLIFPLFRDIVWHTILNYIRNKGIDQ